MSLMMLTHCLFFSILSSPMAETKTAADMTYHRVVSADARRDFYRSAGNNLLGKRIYLYVPVSALLDDPEEVRLRKGSLSWAFSYRSVPLLLRPDHRDLLRIIKRLKRNRKLRSRWVSVRGLVVPDRRQSGRTFVATRHLRLLPSSVKP